MAQARDRQLETEAVPGMAHFFTIWIAQALSLLGSELVQFALVWWLTMQTGSARSLALASAMGLLPQVFIGPFAGALVGRFDRRRMMQAADGLTAAAAMALVVLFALGVARPWHLYAAMFIRALGSAFHWPALQAATTLLVAKKHLTRISGANMAMEGLAGILMPPLGALLLTVLPIQSILFIDIATAGLAIGVLCFVRVPTPRTACADAVSKGAYLRDLKAGLRFVKSLPGLLLLMILGPVFNLLMVPAISFQPLLVTNHFRGGALELAWLQSGFGMGIVLGGLVLSAWGGLKRKSVTGFAALMLRGVGLSVVGLATTGQLWLAIAALFFTGLMTSIVIGSVFAVIQASAPPVMQGRVFTLMRSGFTAAPLLGLLVAGPLADVWGVRPWFVLGGRRDDSGRLVRVSVAPGA
jgi:DHA3 family macrolide efflux protein-like MFS transporter